MGDIMQKIANKEDAVIRGGINGQIYSWKELKMRHQYRKISLVLCQENWKWTNFLCETTCKEL